MFRIGLLAVNLIAHTDGVRRILSCSVGALTCVRRLITGERGIRCPGGYQTRLHNSGPWHNRLSGIHVPALRPIIHVMLSSKPSVGEGSVTPRVRVYRASVRKPTAAAAPPKPAAKAMLW